MTIASILPNIRNKLRQLPRKYYLLVGAVAICMVIAVFFIPKTVELSYAEPTCISELTVLPNLQRQSTNSDYKVEFKDRIKVGNLAVAAKSVCFIPQQAPKQGDVRIATAPWGGWIIPQLYRLKVGPPPKANLAVLEQPVPTTKPIEVRLDQPDWLHSYKLTVDKNTAKCTDSQTGLSCDIEALDLKQGKKYSYQLNRQFADKKSESIGEGVIETLKAVKVVKSPIKNNQTIYSKPTSFKFTLDKPITAAKATIKTGNKSVDTSVSASKKTVTIKLSKQLERQEKYSLTLDDVEAADGSTLVDPYKVNFTMSGGPKVTGISIGGSRVDPGAQAVISFDQDLSDKQDSASLVSLKGGKASVAKIGSRQIAVQLQGPGRCTPFTVSVKGGMLSKHQIKNNDGWSYDSRTICYTTSVYGTSVQGRPLVAYHFGNSGPVTLYVGAIHGNEVSAKYMMESWINELEARPDKIGKRQVVVVPSINPDGVSAGTRNNSRNVNLSRNFPTNNWVKDIDDTDGNNKGGGGKKPLSEPESAALAQLTQRLRPRLLLSYHAVGSLVVGDGSGTYSGGRAAQYASLVGYHNATGEEGTFDYAITGAYEDWTWRNVGIPSLVIELGSYNYHNFDWHRSAMWVMLDQ